MTPMILTQILHNMDKASTAMISITQKNGMIRLMRKLMKFNLLFRCRMKLNRDKRITSKKNKEKQKKKG